MNISKRTKTISLENMYKVPQPVIDGVHANKTEVITEFLESINHTNVLTRAMSLIETPPKGAFNQIREMRKAIQELIKYTLYQRQLLAEFMNEFDRIDGLYAERGNKRWSDMEDEALIELITNGSNMVQLSQTFGRSPSAIQSRITHLVGVKRISQTVAGSFIGTLNDIEVEGFIVGTVSK